ncbi:TRAP transporter substrate-binding protein [Aliibacillus thermotolerans]|uniref:TRAP transporter substrate-binding protein n=1 Tax=Aliibacillus thermotolerans TaxID=1834418 RepID=A0ABW0U5A6_9BACI|nr:TRAP transporter substrate-binding protein [Aliibacillus thermotolerans]MDA3129052.1 DctP family TRAP transporter solute-binding subunit [Aliibacillus thermotolerans]
MKKISKILSTGFLALSLGLFAGCVSGNENTTESGANGGGSGGNGENINFSLTHITQESHSWHKTAEKFGEELEERSDGRMSLEIFAAGQLGSEQDMLQQMETGSVDFGIITNGYMSTRNTEFNAWFMPFVFDSLEEATEARHTDAAKEMLANLESQGFIGMDFIFAGNRHILMEGDIVTSPDDVQGKQVRVIGSPSIQDFWEAVGAGPTPMPLPEVYTSLQTGVIDGIDIDLDALVTEKYYEIADNLTLTNHMTWPAVVMMSQESYSNLSEEDQQIVEEAMSAAVEWGIQEAIQREESNLEEVEAQGITVHHLEDAGAFDEVTKEIREKYSQESDIIASFLESTTQ